MRFRFHYTTDDVNNKTFHHVTFTDENDEFICSFIGNDKRTAVVNAHASLMLLKKFDILDQRDFDEGKNHLDSL